MIFLSRSLFNAIFLAGAYFLLFPACTVVNASNPNSQVRTSSQELHKPATEFGKTQNELPQVLNWVVSADNSKLLLQGHKLDDIVRVTYETGDNRGRELKVLNQNFYVLHLAAPVATPNFSLRLLMKTGKTILFDPNKEPTSLILRSRDFIKPRSIRDRGSYWFYNPPFQQNICNVCVDPRLKHHAYADGVHNDQAAIQEAIDLVHATGGGIVWLPAGTYKLSASNTAQITLSSNVILKGADRKDTRLIYGYGEPGKNFVLLRLDSASQCGITNLSILNINENDRWNNSKSITNLGTDLNLFFMDKIDADIVNSERIELKGRHISITNCQLKSENSLLFLGTSNMVFVANNTLTQKFGVHIDLTHTADSTVRGNKFILDANRGQIVRGCVRHGLAISFASNAVITQNTFSVANGPLKFNNDCEAVLSEGGGGIRTGEEIGSFLDENTLSRRGAYTPGLVIAIVGGRGMGQCRSITKRDKNKIEITPWQIIPDKTSIYSIFKWSNDVLCIEHNEFSDWQRGVWLYHASCRNVAIRNNVFNGTDGVLAVPCQNASRDRGQFNPIWGLAVESNSFRTSPTNDLHAQGVCLIGDLQETRDLLGTLSLNTFIADNSVNPNSAYGSSPVDDEPHVPPLCSYLRVESGPLSQPAPPAMLGTMFAYNFSDPQLSSSARSLPPTINLNGGACGTTILGSSKFVDSEKYWNVPASHGSIDTAVHAEESK